jgi:hypothetical protein
MAAFNKGSIGSRKTHDIKRSKSCSGLAADGSPDPGNGLDQTHRIVLGKSKGIPLSGILLLKKNEISQKQKGSPGFFFVLLQSPHPLPHSPEGEGGNGQGRLILSG